MGVTRNTIKPYIPQPYITSHSFTKPPLKRTLQSPPKRINMCGVFSAIWFETYELWDAFLTKLGGAMIKIGLQVIECCRRVGKLSSTTTTFTRPSASFECLASSKLRQPYAQSRLHCGTQSYFDLQIPSDKKKSTYGQMLYDR